MKKITEEEYYIEEVETDELLGVENSIEFKNLKEKNGNKVKASEMNAFMKEVQNQLIISNNKINEICKQFNDIYSTINTMNQHYYDETSAAVNKTEDVQKEVNRLVELFDFLVNEFKAFRKKVDSEFALLGSENWKSDAENYQKELNVLNDKINEFYSELNELKRKEKRKLTICLVLTIISISGVIALVLLNVFGII